MFKLNLLGGSSFSLWSFAAFSPDDFGGAGTGGDATANASADTGASLETVLFGGGDEGKGNDADASATADADKAKEGEGNEGDKKDGEGDNKDVDPAGPDAVPSDGKYELALPEGMEGVEVDNELVSAVSPLLAGKGFTRAEAQELGAAVMKVQAERAAKETADWQNTVSGWADTAKKDKEIGGDKWDASVISAQKAMGKLGTPALKEYLQASGGGNHPEMIRLMSKVGALISDDAPPTGGAEGSGKPANTAHLLFPSDAPKA